MLVYTRSIALGEVLAESDVSMRTISQVLVTRNTAPPDTVSWLTGRRLVVPVLAGDIVRHTDFSARDDVEAYEACRAVTPGLEADKTVAEIRKRLLKGKTVAPAKALVLIAATELAAGEALTAKHLMTVTVPAGLLTESLLPPEAMPFVVGAKVRVTVRAEETLTWQHFANAAAWQRQNKCVSAVAPKVEAAAEAARKSALASLAQPAPGAAPAEPLAPPKPDASGRVTVVVAASDLTRGAALTESMLATVSLPASFVTASYAEGAQLKRFVGKPLLGALKRGDPVFWQFVGGADCASVVAEAARVARTTAAGAAAKGFKP
ncbi:MAG: hypothetical protein JNK82_04025 [Myxococcaceae bacterium]|nr:hypothetical protein [Myxococcaceae bacterium]